MLVQVRRQDPGDDVGRRANNLEARRRLQDELEAILVATDDPSLRLRRPIPIEGVSHQAGMLRMGLDAASSVLDVNCKAHELDNLYVTDSSAFPSIGAMNPTLTIAANARRLADILKARLGA